MMLIVFSSIKHVWVMNFHRSSGPVRAVGRGVAGVVVRSVALVHAFMKIFLEKENIRGTNILY